MAFDARAIELLTHDGSPFALEDAGLNGTPCRAFSYVKTLYDVYRKAWSYGGVDFLIHNANRCSYRDVLQKASRLSLMLAERYGLKAGDRVGLALENSEESVVSFIAVTSVGATAVLVGMCGSAELSRRLANAGCSLLIASEPVANSAEEWLARLPLILVGAGSPEPAIPSFASLLHGYESAKLRLAMPDPGDDAVIAFTSGTTGAAKAVALTHRGLTNGLMNMMLGGALTNASVTGEAPRGGFRTRSSVLVLSPLWHASGYMQLLANLMMSGKLVLPPQWDCESICELVHREGITSIAGMTPAILKDLLVLPGASTQLASLQTLNISGFALFPELLQRVRVALPKIVFTNSYSLTETNGPIAMISGAELDEDPEASGHVLPTVDIEVRKENEAVPAGELGEIFVRGAMLMRTYCGVDGCIRDGWFKTGDVGRLSRDNRLYVVGRTDDLVALRGKEFSCRQIERLLAAQPNVSDVAVFVVRDNDQAEPQIVAAICAAAECSIDLEELGEIVAAHFPDLPAIELYRLAELPRTRAGKLDTRALITSHSSLVAEARNGEALRPV